jgi:hypothetical protein
MARRSIMKKKTHEIRFRGSPLDVARVTALARQSELTPSAVLRRLLAQEVERLGLEVKA